MEPSLYKAATNGDDVELDRLIQRLDIQNQLTQNNSTVLHVAAQFEQLTCLKKILVLEGSSSLLNRKNIKGDTALHVAMRQGHTDIVDELVRFANQVGIGTAMLREPNEDNDMALHLAVKNGDLEMVELLTRADPQFPHPPNNANKTPLYLACERGYDGIVSKITSPTYSVADGGGNVLHAAVVSTCTVQTIENLLNQQPDLIKEIDEYGWTPLYWAVRIKNEEKVSKLLDNDRSSVAYTPALNDDDKIALHIAVAHGYVEIMKMLLSHCPDSWEIVDGKGQNILHIAIEMEQGAVVNEAKQYPWFKYLITQSDNDGNTPLDLASSPRLLYQRLGGDYYMKLTLLQDCPIHWDQTCREKDYIQGQKKEREDQRKKVIEFEKQMRETMKKQWEETREDLHKIGQSHLVVATLIATIAFTFGFTIPGIDRSSSSREPVVPLKEEAFKAFLISNSIAAICSLITVFFHITISNFETDQYVIRHLYPVVYSVLRVSVAAIFVAFVTGTYAVLITQSRRLVFIICVVAVPPTLLTLPYLEVINFCKPIVVIPVIICRCIKVKYF